MIGARIRGLRQAQGRSLADVAGKAKVSVATLSRIENDKQSVDLGLFLVLAKVLQVAASELLGSEGNGEADDRIDPLARRIAMLETKKRTELWREVAAERRAQRGRGRRTDSASQVEEMLAQIDFLREELEIVRKSMKKR
ncbi:MAG TPA: helix-turn-helix transcriptional regulator [Thermoanaerobaculia bacterium]|nr:helix-turn-helix transcriptional regulator [Thermoanaerobaculia bacterium]